MISHDLPAALREATHILHLGRFVFCGTTQEYLQSGRGRLLAAEAAEDSPG